MLPEFPLPAAAYASTGQAGNEKAHFSSSPSQPQYGWQVLVQLLTFSLATAPPTLETALACTELALPGTGAGALSLWQTAQSQRTDLLSHCRKIRVGRRPSWMHVTFMLAVWSQDLHL